MWGMGFARVVPRHLPATRFTTQRANRVPCGITGTAVQKQHPSPATQAIVAGSAPSHQPTAVRTMFGGEVRQRPATTCQAVSVHPARENAWNSHRHPSGRVVGMPVPPGWQVERSTSGRPPVTTLSGSRRNRPRARRHLTAELCETRPGRRNPWAECPE